MSLDYPRQHFEEALKHVPEEWRLPMIEIFDTVEMCSRFLRTIGIEPSSDAVVKMTELVLQRHDRKRK